MKTPRALCLVVLLAGCDTTPGPPSEGDCAGDIMGIDVSGPMKGSSNFYRDDQDGGVEHAWANFDYTGAASDLRINIHLDDMPSGNEGIYELPDPYGFVDVWSIDEPGSAITDGSLTIGKASRERFSGEFTMEFFDGSEVDCTYSVRRDYAKDTDD